MGGILLEAMEELLQPPDWLVCNAQPSSTHQCIMLALFTKCLALQVMKG